MEKRIEIKGMVNNAPLNEIEDGTCNEIINLRPKNSAWRPVGKKKELFVLTENYDDIYVHQTPSDSKNYIGQLGSNIYRFKEDGSKILIHTISSEYVGMKHIGNILLIIHKNGIVKILYKPDTDSYGEPLEKFPEHPTYEVSTEYWKQQDEAIEVEKEISDQEVIEDFMKIHVPGNYLAELADLKDDKYYEGYCAVRFAYRLYDESFVIPTIPKLRYVGNKLDIQHFYSNYGADKYIIKFDKITVGNLKYSIGTLPGELDDWKDIIKSICVFMTRPVSYYDFDDIDIDFNHTADDLTWTDNDVKPFLKDYKRDITIEDLIGKNPYYLVDEIDIEDAENHSEGIYIEHAIETNEILPVNSTHHTTVGNTLLTYNSRLMLGDTKSILFEGFPVSSFLARTGNSTYNYNFYIETELSDQNGDYLVRSKASRNISASDFQLEDIIGYPDSRVNKMKFIWEQVDNGSIYKMLELSVFKNDNFNFSATIPNSIELSKQITVTLLGDENKSVTVMNYPGIRDYINNQISTSFREIKDQITNTQLVKVSELNNPFVFPAKQTYTIGSSKVLAMAVNTIPLSTGQFGQHPVTVFCSDGIYVLAQGNSEILFSSVLPANRDVINNPENVIGLEYGILYSTEEGLKLLNGTQSELLSEALEGEQFNFLKGDPNYELFTDHENLYTLLSVLNQSVDFSIYLTGAKIGFDQVERELIISNIDYNYSFVYSFKSGVFFKITEVFSHFVSDYPDMLGVFGSNLYNLSKETKENTLIHLHTQPIKLNGRNFKTITRFSLKGDIKATDDVHYCGLYVYISNDLKNWELISGVQTNELFNHILQRTMCSSLYICVHFGSLCKPDTYINFIDFDYKVKYTNKLR